MNSPTLSPVEFAGSLEQYYVDAADDMRKVIVGIQSEANIAEIYGRYAHLFTTEQLEALSALRDSSTPDEHERLRRLWFEAADALAAADVVQAAEDLMNERLAWRGDLDGESMSLNALGARIASDDDFEARERVYALMCVADDEFAARDVTLAAQAQLLRAEVFEMPGGEIEIAEQRMGIDVRRFSHQINDVLDATAARYHEQAAVQFPHLLGRDATKPSRAHAAYMRSLHEWDHVFTSERFVDVCERTVAELGFPLSDVPTILPDLEDRADKDPRACVIPVRVPEEVHLVVRPTGGLTDYQAFLHEAGHALHFGLTDAELPFELRAVSPDNALTEIYSYVVERITHEPLWHQRHFGLSVEDSERVVAQTKFIDATLFRRYGAKLAYELEFWADPRNEGLPERYRTLLGERTGMTYSASQFASDMDPGLYAADYLRAWRTSAQVIGWLRREFGAEWFCNGQAAPFLRELFVQGSVPSNEDVSVQIGSTPDDFDDLIASLSA